MKKSKIEYHKEQVLSPASSAKSWRFREGLVKYLMECLAKFKNEISNS